MQLTEKAPTRKQQIQVQAMSLFRRNGYAATTMRDLAQDLGIEAASLYSHIRSKQQILHEIWFDMANAFFEAIDDIVETDPVCQLKSAIRAHFNVISQHTNATAVFFNEWRHLNEPALSEFLTMRKQYEQFYTDIIQRGIDSGLFKNVDHKLAMMTILSAINWTHQWYRPGGKLSVDEIADQLSRILISGLMDTNRE